MALPNIPQNTGTETSVKDEQTRAFLQDIGNSLRDLINYEEQKRKDSLEKSRESRAGGSMFAGASGTQTVSEEVNKQGGLIGSILKVLGVGALASLGKAVATLGLGFAAGMTALGAGISGFLIGFYGGENILEYITDSESGKKMIPLFENVGKAFESLGLTALVSIGLAGALGAKLANQKGDESLKGAVKGALGMGTGIAALGAGLSAFMIAFYSGENILKYITDSESGKTMVTLFGNVGKAFDALGTTALVSIGLAGAMGAMMANQKGDKSLFGAVKGAIGLGTGIAAFGAGLAGFMLAFGATDTILKVISDDKVGSSLPKLFKNVSNAFENLGPEVLTTMAVAGGIGTAFGIQRAAGGALGLTLFGGAIAGFIAAFDGIATGANALGIDGSKSKVLLTNIAEGLNAFNPDSLVALGAALAGSSLLTMAAVGAGAACGGKAAGKAALALGAAPVGLTLFGLGIGGFIAGLSVATEYIGDDKLDKFTGKGLVPIMKNVAEGLNAFDASSLVALGAALAGSSLFTMGAVGAGGLMGIAAVAAAPVGLTLFGLGIGGFLAGLAGVGDKLKELGVTGEGLVPILTNVGKSIGGFLGGIGSGAFEQMEKIDGEKLEEVGQGIGALGKGLLSYTSDMIGTKFNTIISDFLGIFASNDNVENFKKFTEIDGTKLMNVSLGIEKLGKGLQEFAEGTDKNTSWVTAFKGLFTEDPFEKIKKGIDNFKDDRDINNMVKLGKGIGELGRGLQAFAIGEKEATSISTAISKIFSGDPLANIAESISKFTPEQIEKMATVGGPAANIVAIGGSTNNNTDARQIDSRVQNIVNYYISPEADLFYSRM